MTTLTEFFPLRITPNLARAIEAQAASSGEAPADWARKTLAAGVRTELPKIVDQDLVGQKRKRGRRPNQQKGAKSDER